MCWGSNGNGQLGIGTMTDMNIPSVVNLGGNNQCTILFDLVLKRQELSTIS